MGIKIQLKNLLPQKLKLIIDLEKILIDNIFTDFKLVRGTFNFRLV